MARDAQAAAVDQETQASRSVVALGDAPAAVVQVSQSLLSLGDDPLRTVLTFLSPADGRRGVGTAAKLFRAAASSTNLARARGADSYVLRERPIPLTIPGIGIGQGNHGVVHALATAFGTRRWPTGVVSRSARHSPGWFEEEDDDEELARVMPVPPPRLQVLARRGYREGIYSDDYAPFFAAAVIYPGAPGWDGVIPWGVECSMDPGCFVEYQLPFMLRVASFRIGFASCSAHQFKYWTFEAFDEDWKVLYDSGGVSPWPLVGPEPRYGREGPHQIVEVHDAFPSSRFRICMQANSELPVERCMHLRGFELFGTVLPPWRLD